MHKEQVGNMYTIHKCSCDLPPTNKQLIVISLNHGHA